MSNESQDQPADDDWTDAPATGIEPKWIGGIAAPLGTAGYGAYCLMTGTAVLWGEHGSQLLRGADARALAIAYVSIDCSCTSTTSGETYIASRGWRWWGNWSVSRD